MHERNKSLPQKKIKLKIHKYVGNMHEELTCAMTQGAIQDGTRNVAY